MAKHYAYRKTAYHGVFYRGSSLRFRYTDEHGKRREIKAGEISPREASMARAAAQQAADRIRLGIDDPRAAKARAASELPIATIIDRYIESLEARNRTPGHVKNTRRFLERWARECRVECLRDASPHRLTVWLDELADKGPDERGASARTVRAYRTAVLALCAWATDHELCAINPIRARLVPAPNPEADPRRKSGTLTIEQVERLLSTAPPRRAAFYSLQAFMGLRPGEVTRLVWGDIDLESATLTIDAGRTKNRRAAELPIPDPVLARLQAIQPPDAKRSTPVLKLAPRYRTWKKDLRIAQIIGEPPVGSTASWSGRYFGDRGFVDDHDRRLDRKCLRATFGTLLYQAGVDIRDAQRLLRHRDIRLTTNIYTHIRLSALRAASDKATKPAPVSHPRSAGRSANAG